jgi:hypothetical protein
MKDLRLLDHSERFVRWVPRDEAEKLIAEGRVDARGTGRRRTLILRSARLLEDFESPEQGQGDRKFHYSERYQGHEVVVLKRLDSETGSFKKWDNNLTFEELRAGKTISATARAKRREEFRKAAAEKAA